ncbi:MAG: S-methyl-5-thioribose-1-phosphate isomerase [Armatimonadota bacterium]|nr:S-methyl-5-thioribose-1-phosphate isomerase [Armatimonadota bacterium]MCX7778487.1 S-methyl-5-thioribose-1-phosphate isomerase [Armatimonadota bacterium]MDW8026004.1 S-methyl-5-thioribose-1-phosphate isomerase [Armatimonadota bacterium]
MPHLSPFEWLGDALRIIDQTALPLEERYIVCRTAEDVADAIKSMKVRGAPAIGCVAAFGMVLAAKTALAKIRCRHEMFDELMRAKETLASTRPTAVNLFWALDRMTKVVTRCGTNLDELISELESEAIAIAREDVEANMRMGMYGASLIPERANILTHCNAGALATAGYGTALGVIRAAHEQGKKVHVWVDETRPFLQGARLTAWELQRDGIPFTLISDNVAGMLMRSKMVDLVIVGADRIAANGDVANKIGTYSLAVLARHHGIPFYVAAPTSTIDLSCHSGDEIPIEQRDGEEVRTILGARIVPADVPAFNPAFDVTPHELVEAIITERGIIKPPFEEGLKNILLIQ